MCSLQRITTTHKVAIQSTPISLTIAFQFLRNRNRMMQLILRMRQTLALMWLCLASASAAHAADVSVPNGSFQGSGRACYGALKISEKQITWNTPFSKCATRSFRVAELDEQAGRRAHRYELRGVGKNCLYRTLVLRHPDPQQSGASWDLTSYRNHADYRANNTEKAMSCALIHSE